MKLLGVGNVAGFLVIVLRIRVFGRTSKELVLVANNVGDGGRKRNTRRRNTVECESGSDSYIPGNVTSMQNDNDCYVPTSKGASSCCCFCVCIPVLGVLSKK
jgi:hypothetical protein